MLLCGMSESAPGGEAASSTDAESKEPSESCIDCGGGFKNSYFLQKHYRSDDNDCTGFECDYCERVDLASQKGKRQHEAKQHKTQHKDPEVMRELYCERKWGIRRIGDKFGIADKTVADWLECHGIETRDFESVIRADSANYHTDKHGYPTWRAFSGDTYASLRVHRLLAVAEYGFDALEDKVVHHTNGVKWDNRPENIEVMGDSEHKRHHAREMWG